MAEANRQLASVTAERDALRLGQKVVAERQREACAKTCELIRSGPWGNHEQQEALDNWKTAARFVRETPLVTDAPAAEREENVMAAADAESDAHQAKMAALSREDDAWWHPAVAMANEAIREENASPLCKPSRQELCALETFQPNVADYLRDLESRLAAALAECDTADEGRKARIRELENLLKAIMEERDAAVEFSKSTVREG